MIVCLDSVACTPDNKDLEFQYSVTWCRLMTKWNLVMKLSTISYKCNIQNPVPVMNMTHLFMTESPRLPTLRMFQLPEKQQGCHLISSTVPGTLDQRRLTTLMGVIVR